MKFEDFFQGFYGSKRVDGIASYYTVESCKREGTSGIMANGKPLNDKAFTCASWLYPFGTRLLVVNSVSGERVEVEVTDRGPAKKLVEQGRIIDLSKAAFESLAPLSWGLIHVCTFKIEKVEK